MFRFTLWAQLVRWMEFDRHFMTSLNTLSFFHICFCFRFSVYIFFFLESPLLYKLISFLMKSWFCFTSKNNMSLCSVFHIFKKEFKFLYFLTCPNNNFSKLGFVINLFFYYLFWSKNCHRITNIFYFLMWHISSK